MKKVIRGFKGSKGGDEDMWCCEGPPTLVESYRRFEEEIHILQDIKEQCEERNSELLSFCCTRLINIISMRIRDICNVEMCHNRLLEKFEKDGKCSDLTKSYVKSQVYNCKEVTKRSLNINRTYVAI